MASTAVEPAAAASPAVETTDVASTAVEPTAAASPAVETTDLLLLLLSLQLLRHQLWKL